MGSDDFLCDDCYNSIENKQKELQEELEKYKESLKVKK
jgi:ribosome-associated translation inhibitor RaiA